MDDKRKRRSWVCKQGSCQSGWNMTAVRRLDWEMSKGHIMFLKNQSCRHSSSMLVRSGWDTAGEGRRGGHLLSSINSLKSLRTSYELTTKSTARFKLANCVQIHKLHIIATGVLRYFCVSWVEALSDYVFYSSYYGLALYMLLFYAVCICHPFLYTDGNRYSPLSCVGF